MGKMTLRLDDELHAQLGEAAAAEHRSLHAEIVVRLERSLVKGEGVTASAAAVVPDTPESVEAKLVKAREAMESAQRIFGDEDDQGALSTPPEVIEQMEREAREERGPVADAASDVDPPTPAAPERTSRRRLEEVVGDSKAKPKGTVSATQAQLAREAQLQQEQRIRLERDHWSIVCPNRKEHVAGQRCSQCGGIGP
jgi:plasmid stability protein